MTTRRSNGHGGLRMPDVPAKIEYVDPYAGFWVEIRANAPVGVLLDIVEMKITDKSLPRVIEMLAAVTIRSNLVDRHGEAIDLTTVPGWRKVGLDFIGLTIGYVPEAMQRPFRKPTTNSSPTSSATARTPQASTD